MKTFQSPSLIQSESRNLSASITKEERDIAVHRLSVYEKWCSDNVLQIGTYNTVLLIPIENITPRYRDEPLGCVSGHLSIILYPWLKLDQKILQSRRYSNAFRGTYLESTRVHRAK